ncbi:endonuclease/exonuclease/phosphatase family protein [Corallincola luteus]|uniref:Endonuclease/exonuclease/phosphatase family protein n=1 Tax=Corallincola luteus TaxID=1775177 RepID=A0ABY2AN31_9GAMM|nr:endonuclease/exonuclease/phosphatase family protein [Corallincola luteus]TCI04047.1 endonuclease/exonuclease/phosphatase family protein [Corallincola luteus]
MSALQAIISTLILWVLSGLANIEVPEGLSYWQPDRPHQALSDCVEGLPERQLLQAAAPMQTSRKTLGPLLRVAVWNSYKLEQPGWQQELAELTAQRDLLLLQEVVARAELAPILGERPSLLLQAFTYNQLAAGVMTSAVVSPSAVCGMRTAEPWIGVPKSLLANRYPLHDGQSLLVVNLHGINFVWELEAYQQQLDLLAALVKQHRGPVIVAGDFNSWRQERIDRIGQTLKPLQLRAVRPMPDRRTRIFGFAIDQLWLRGFEVEQAASYVSDSSDHNGLLVELRLKPAPPAH